MQSASGLCRISHLGFLSINFKTYDSSKLNLNSNQAMNCVSLKTLQFSCNLQSVFIDITLMNYSTTAGLSGEMEVASKLCENKRHKAHNWLPGVRIPFIFTAVSHLVAQRSSSLINCGRQWHLRIICSRRALSQSLSPFGVLGRLRASLTYSPGCFLSHNSAAGSIHSFTSPRATRWLFSYTPCNLSAPCILHR